MHHPKDIKKENSLHDMKNDANLDSPIYSCIKRFWEMWQDFRKKGTGLPKWIGRAKVI